MSNLDRVEEELERIESERRHSVPRRQGLVRKRFWPMDQGFVVVGGDKYVRSHIEPPVALGSIDVWVAWATAEDET